MYIAQDLLRVPGPSLQTSPPGASGFSKPSKSHLMDIYCPQNVSKAFVGLHSHQKAFPPLVQFTSLTGLKVSCTGTLEYITAFISSKCDSSMAKAADS